MSLCWQRHAFLQTMTGTCCCGVTNVAKAYSGCPVHQDSRRGINRLFDLQMSVTHTLLHRFVVTHRLARDHISVVNGAHIKKQFRIQS